MATSSEFRSMETANESPLFTTNPCEGAISEILQDNERDGSNFQVSEMFQTLEDCHSNYCASNVLSDESDCLLGEQYQKTCTVRETEYSIPRIVKKPLSQRSASDYSLSKRHDELKSAVPLMRGCDGNQDIKPFVHPTEIHPGEARSGPFAQSQCTCAFVKEPNLDDIYPSHFTKRNSLPTDCEPSGSGLCRNLDDVKGSEDRNLYKTYNLNPTVNLKIFDLESLSESGDLSNNGAPMEIHNNQTVLNESWFIPSACRTFSRAELSGSASAAQLSIASSFGDSNIPTCKICHMPAKPDDPLISPCRCTGTLRYIHCACLMRWLEICNKRSRKPPACELCKYQFHWHKKFKVRHWQFPHCSWRDKVLHTLFLLAVMVMIACAIVTVVCFRQHRGNKPDVAHMELTQSEIITLVCGALFFFAFFVAMYVEIKARNTIYKLLVKFIYLNQQWYIDEYDKKGENTAIDV